MQNKLPYYFQLRAERRETARPTRKEIHRDQPKRIMNRVGRMNTAKRAKNQKKKTRISQNDEKVNIINLKKRHYAQCLK